MALTKDQKKDVVEEVSNLLENSKLTVIAQYKDTSVKQMQELRKSARESETLVKVIKNRLVIKAIKANDRFSTVNTDSINGQLLYAFNAVDEVAPAQSLATFAKKNPSIKFVAGLTSDGQLISAEDVAALAALPSKDQLRAQLVGTIAAPLSGFMNVLSGNVRGVLNVLQARADSIN